MAFELIARPGTGELFLDRRGIASADNLTWTVEMAGKHRGNPILTPTFERGTPDEGGVMNHGTVLLEKGRFRMWYSGWEIPGHGPTPKGRNWDHYVNICYAESHNGVAWDRPKLGLMEYMGSKDNNLVPNLWLIPTVLRDDLESDPQRRYKCFEQVKPHREHPERAHLHTSPDGFHWRTEDSPRAFPGARPWYFNWFSVFRDEDDPNPRRRWKAYGSYGPSAYERSAGVAFSADGVHWTGYPKNPILDTHADSESNCHDLAVWREKGLYVGLLQVCDANKNYEYELVVSRDGVDFSRVAGGRSFIARGSGDDWDLGSITLFSSPVCVGDETWFYYGSVARPIANYDVQMHMREWTQNPCSGGVAVMRAGRYAGFTVKDGESVGRLQTVPIADGSGDPLGLSLNAACDEASEIRVQLLDALTNHVVPGYSLAECEPVNADGVFLPVRWKEHPFIASALKSVRLQFELRGAAALYGFEWSTPR